MLDHNIPATVRVDAVAVGGIHARPDLHVMDMDVLRLHRVEAPEGRVEERNWGEGGRHVPRRRVCE